MDLIFARAKPKGLRKLDWAGFTDACVMLAEKRFAKTWKEEGKEAAIRKLYELIAGSKGPQANAVNNPHLIQHHWLYTDSTSEGHSGQHSPLCLAAVSLCATLCVVGQTKADNVRFHDDKSTYTGVYARGGPTNVDSQPLSYHSP